MKDIKRPSLFKDKDTIRRRMNNLGSALEEGTLDAGMEALNKLGKRDLEVKRKPKYLQVTEKRLNKMGVVDLKPAFSRSSKKILKEGGGWYLRVPIRRKSRDMSRRMYEQLRNTNIEPSDRQNIVSSYLYDGRKVSDANELNYKPKSHMIEKKNIGNNRHTYTAYRTVSDKSPSSSWIVNRDKVNKKDTSKTFVNNVDRLMRWKMKNGWS